MLPDVAMYVFIFCSEYRDPHLRVMLLSDYYLNKWVVCLMFSFCFVCLFVCFLGMYNRIYVSGGLTVAYVQTEKVRTFWVG